MKKNTMYRLTAFATALAVICGSAVSCSSENKTDKSNTPGSPKTSGSNDAELAKTSVATSLKAEALDLTLNVESVSSLTRLEGSDKIFIVATVKEEAQGKSDKEDKSKDAEDTEEEEATTEKAEDAEEEEATTEKAEDAEEEATTEKAEDTEEEATTEKAEDADKEEEATEKTEEAEDSEEAEDEVDPEAEEDFEVPEYNYVRKFFVTDTSLTEIKELEVEFDDMDNENTYFTVATAGDGTISVLQTINDYGDMEIPDEDDVDFDYEAFEAARVSTYKYYNIDADGNIISKCDLTGLEEYAGTEDFMADNIYAFGKDKMLVILNEQGMDDAHAVALDISGKVLGSVDLGGFQWIMGTALTSDGKCVVGGYSSMGVKLKYFDTEELKPDGEEIEIEDTSVYNLNSMLNGNDEYAIFANTMSGLYGIKADGTCEEKINWADCDLDTNSFIEVIPLDNGEYAVFNFDYMSGEGCFYRLVQRAEGELDNTKIVTIGTLYDDYQVSQMISTFNKEHDDIRMKAVSYEKYYDYDEENEKLNNSPSKQLKMDIIAGKAPDMIFTYDRSIITSLSGKEIFTDLYGLMDDELKKEDIIENVLAANEYNGKLLALSPTFYVESYACKTKYCDKENWTFEDMKETYESLPDGMGLCEIDSNEAVLQLLLPEIAGCIDYSTNTCNFDTPEVKAMVEFCAQFPDTEEIIDWKNASDEEMNDFMDDIENKAKEDKTLLSSAYLMDFRDYKRLKQVTFDDDITLVGMPSSDGQGGLLGFNQAFAILDSSDVKAECWEFIKEFFTDESYKDAYYFPTKKSAFDKVVENAMKKRTYTDEKGVEHEIDDTEFVNGKEVKIDLLTEEEKDYIVDYVKNTTKVMPDISDEVSEMSMECLNYYFKGEKSLDEAIALLQSKISLYLSEQS